MPNQNHNRFTACFVYLMILFAQRDVQSDDVDFATQIRPIFEARCHSCHGSEESEAGLRLDLRDRAFAGSDSGAVITKGNSAESTLIQRIRSDDPDERMPPKGKPLSKQEIDLLSRWVDSDAPWPEGIDPTESYASHWAYQPIKRHPIPRVTDESWPRNAIDCFILEMLESKSVNPSPMADRATLIRRLYLDLTGMPPSPEEWKSWMDVCEPDWYDQLVDRLLASPHYGERWGRYWLDLARYADSDGYEKDQPRPHAYQWRDWVIRAFNRDLPFDQFTEQQIAGDLLPGATPDVQLATGFHRNTLTNREGGIDKEEDRVKQVVDRINTVSTVWLGLTVECAQCHTHKYDPITQREYYQLYAFFNSSDEVDFPLEPTPTQRLEFERAKRQHEQSTEELQSKLRAIREEISTSANRLENQWLAKHPDGVPEPSENDAVAHFSFDTPDLLANEIDSKVGKFLGAGSPTIANGRDGNALQFDGQDDRLEVSVNVSQPDHHPLTLSAWCSYQGGVGAVLTKLDETADFRGIDFTINDGMLEVHLVDTWPNNAIKVTTKSRIEQDRWSHLAVRYDGSKKAAGVQVFVDGRLQELDVQFDQLSGTFAIDQPIRAGSRRTGTFLKGQLDELRVYYRALDDAEIKMLAGNPRLAEFLTNARLPKNARTAEQQARQIEFLLASRDDAVKLRQQIAELEKKPPTLHHGTGMGLAQRDNARPTHVHIRGDFLAKGDEVEVGTPRFLPDLTVRGVTPDRLDLARWILSSENTLTPRVTVNRFWQTFFGLGIVESDRDFGSQGASPTHAKLLDWLATEFIRNDWSIKQLHRLIVTSATYQQSSAARPELYERDPYNTWLARQNRQRVDAEIVRDIALATSGLLDTRIHGPSVYPPLPPGIIELAFVDVINRGPWKVSEGGDRFRRGLYTFFQRTSAYPMLALFDAPDSNVTCTRREQSNTPLQALTLWNDNVFMKCATEFARRALTESDNGSNNSDAMMKSRAEYLFVLGLSRAPTDADLADLMQLYESSLRVYQEDDQLTGELVASARRPSEVTNAEFAAWISVARTIMNLDAFINRE